MKNKPHGGKLVDKRLSKKEKKRVLENKNKFKTLTLSEEQVKDVKNIGRGVYSPLTGFLKETDFKSAVSLMRLADGTVWPIPIVLDVDERDYKKIKGEKAVFLVDKDEKEIALLRNIEVYKYDKDFFAKNVFGTLDKRHPGVESVYEMGKYLVGGEIDLIDDSKEPFPSHNFTPRETRKLFKDKGWKKVVAFQTRNVPHIGHEYLQRKALGGVDGAFIQPVIGEKKISDFKDEYILTSYEILIDKYYPKNKVVLGILPLKMRYAGPREAVLHALVRKNFGATHFIVGRDHAGVGDYYPPFAAQEIFDSFEHNEIGVEILKFPEVIFCQECSSHRFIDECGHERENKISFSGTKLRENIINREQPPFYIIRPEVYNLLSSSHNTLVDDMYKKRRSQNQKGFVLWFTGLSQAGKTTLGDKMFEILKRRGHKVERLDGDVVRENLTKDLGFSKEDRDENIRRVGFVAKLLSRNGVGVIASFISPYRNQREGVRKEVEGFIEIFCNSPVEVCEERDTKGLYKKAHAGKIENFTGVSDPYEHPENPEVHLSTHKETVEESVENILRYLREKDII
jgi:sulfate adenylyltransferase